MAEPTKKRVVNPALRDLMQSALRAADGMTIEELGDRTRLGRDAVGRIVRGEVRRLAPEQANALVTELPVTMEQLLATCGYHMGVKGQARLPQNLVEALLALPPEIQESIARLAQAAAKGAAAQRIGPP